MSAAVHGVVTSCVSQAARLGLWANEEPERIHVAADPHASGNKPERAHVHWMKPMVPRHPDALTDSVVNVLAAVADCEPFERALATWESAAKKGLTSLPELNRYPWRGAARELVTRANPFADVGTETYLRERLRWLGVRIVVQVWLAGHRVDALLGDRRVQQIDGAHHVGAQRTEDLRHDAELRLQGYHVIRISYPQLMHDWPAVQDMIMRALAQGLHQAG